MRALRLLGIVIGGLLAAVVALFVSLQTPPGQRAVAALISNVASTPDSGLDVTGLTGFFPTDLQVAQISYRDRQGPWLTAENLRLRWSFASLLRGRLRIENLSADRVAILRPPEPSKEKSADEGDGSSRLPFGVDLREFLIGDLHLAAPLAGVDSHWKVAGNALLPADLAEGRLTLGGDRTDGPEGRLSTDIRFDAQRRTVDGEISLTERRGGIVAAMLKRPDIDDLTMSLAARGDAHAGKAELTLSAGDAARATGKAVWEPRGAATAVSVQLDTAGPGLPPGRLTDAARGPITLRAEATIDDKLLTVSEVKFTAGSLGLEGSARYDRVTDRLEGTATVRADEPGTLGPLVGGATWRRLHMQAKVDVGALATSPQGTMTLAGGADDVSLAALDGRLPPVGNTAFEAALGVNDGKITVTSLDIGSPLASVKGSGSYLPATRAGEARVTVASPNLAPLSALAGRPLGGSTTLDLTATTDADGLKFGWQGTVSDISAAGLPTDLVTARVTLSGAATLRYDEAWSLSDVRVASEGGTLGIAGSGRGATGDLDLSLNLPKLGRLQSELAGNARVSGSIRLRNDGTDLRLTAELSDVEHRRITSRR